MKITVDKKHSFYMMCWDCLMWGTPAPNNFDTCGNCNGRNVTIYYPARKNKAKRKTTKRTK